MNPLPEAPGGDRAQRQRDLVPPERLAGCRAIVIGVGAIGRQVALQLAAVGVPQLMLFDHDTVQMENLAPQGYAPADLHEAKVQATAAWCRQLNPDVEVTAVAERFKRSSARPLARDLALVVFVCVDSIQTRRLIWETVQGQVALLIDGRMSAEVLRVLTVPSPDRDGSSYPETLFSADEAYAGSCTAKSTIYSASIAAGLMVGQFTRWLRHLPVDADLTLNLLATELTVTPAP